jgi:hypothetical protein
MNSDAYNFKLDLVPLESNSDHLNADLSYLESPSVTILITCGMEYRQLQRVFRQEILPIKCKMPILVAGRSRVGLWPLTFWDCGFEFRRKHGCLSLVYVGRCQVGVSTTGRSLIQRSPTECGVSLSKIRCNVSL